MFSESICAARSSSYLFLPDGTSLISLTSFDVKIWDTVANNLILEAAAPPVAQNSVVISPDGKMLVVIGFLWDIESRETIGRLGEDFVHAAVFTDNKTLKFLTNDMTVTTWDVEKRELLSTVPLAGVQIVSYRSGCCFLTGWKTGRFGRARDKPGE